MNARMGSIVLLTAASVLGATCVQDGSRAGRSGWPQRAGGGRSDGVRRDHLRSRGERSRASEGMIAVDEGPSVRMSPGEGAARRRGVVSQGLRVYLRTLAPEDVEYLSEWAEDPF